MLKEKIRNHQKTIGMHINLNDVAVGRIAGLAGYDFVWIDMEHSNLSLDVLLAHIIAIRAGGTNVIVRVPQDDLTYTKKVLEMGVDGIIFPMIRSAEEANRQISNTLYPPYGTRGFGPMHAVGYGFDSTDDYIRNTVDNVCRFIQIEHIDAVKNLDEIMKNEYIDGYIFGPCDLSGSIRELGQVYAPGTTALIRDCVTRLKAAGKYVGVSTGDVSDASIRHWHDLNIDMISAGADFGFLQQAALKNRLNMERIHKAERWYENEKTFYTKDNLTPDTDCALRPPYVFGPEALLAKCYSAKERKWQSAPCVSRTKDGTLFCAFSGDNYSGDEGPNNYNVIMKSADGGAAWQPVSVIDHPDSVRLHEPVLWTDPDGMLWHFWTQSYNWWDGRGGVWAMQADPSKKVLTWSEPRRLCDGVMATAPLVLANGLIMLPVSVWKHYKSEYNQLPHLEESSVYISADKGKSFVRMGGADERETTFDENAVVERSDGSLYMIMRCEHSISYSISNDLGKTWSKPEKLMDHTSSRSWLAKFPSGNYLLVTNDSGRERTRMTAFLSEDECATWEKKLLLDEKTAVSYPCGCIDQEGRVYVTYDFNRYREEEIYLASFTEEDIRNGRLTDGNSFLGRLVCKGENGKETQKTHEE